MKKINEVKVINPDILSDKEPLKDNDKLRIYHGFNNFRDVEIVMKKGLSGKERATRIYSYEYVNNPKGLFVTIDLKRAAEFAGSGVIIEFTSKVEDLEAPVWVGGRSYFVQGEYTKSFKDMDEREQQRLINRQKSGESPYDYISKSDRPELASTIFENPERQALYIGNLNRNMIGNVWYNKTLHVDNRINGQWVRMSRKQFIKELDIKTNKSIYDFFDPNDDFSLDKIFSNLEITDVNNQKRIIDYLISGHLKHDLWPKQIEQIEKLNNNGYFEKYLKNLESEENLNENILKIRKIMYYS
jgi:hypothetical protein